MNFVREISKYHRIQASEGYRKAAEKAAELLSRNGIHTRIHRYPSDGKTYCFTQKLFKEWNCTEGWLEITNPWYERLSDFNREEMSLIQRSTNMDYSNTDVPIIYVDDNIEPSDFKTPLEGALLFVENYFEKWIDRVIELKGLGIITVSMPEINPVRVNMSEDSQMADSHSNLSFHIYNAEQENKLCGFAISPRSGKKLKESCIALSKDGDVPLARFKVASTLHEGFIENVDAFIPGESDEEILMIAHLCHPRSSVNDNASGAAVAMESICTLKRLIDKGILPIPKRSIRLLLVPEFTGTYAFLKENEDRLSKIVAGLNIDMVGGYQDGNAGALIIVDTPNSAYSFAGDLASIIMDEVSRECTFGGKDRYIPLFLGLRVPFATGSDHYILSDPTINIPAVAITQWPDKTYHTSADCINHIDPKMLKRAIVLSSAYCYIYARFSLEDAKEVTDKVSSRFYETIISLRKLKSDSELNERLDYLEEVYFSTLNGVLSLLDKEDIKTLLAIHEKEKGIFLQLRKHISCVELTSDSISLSSIPTRLFKGPLHMRSIISDLTIGKREKLKNLHKNYPDLTFLDDYLMYEADGKRTVNEIGRRVYFQTGIKCERYAIEFFQTFSELKLIELTDIL